MLRLAAHSLQNLRVLFQALNTRSKKQEIFPLRKSLEPSPAAKESTFIVCSVLVAMLRDRKIDVCVIIDFSRMNSAIPIKDLILEVTS